MEGLSDKVKKSQNGIKIQDDMYKWYYVLFWSVISDVLTWKLRQKKVNK